MPKDPSEVTELFDVEVSHVGLVAKGANRRRWFLLKGDTGGLSMEDTQDQLQVIAELEQEEEVTHGSWQKVLGLLKTAFAPVELEDVEEVEEVPEVVETQVEKSDVDIRFEALEK